MIRIACTAVCKRIMAGRGHTADAAFLGSPKDVTPDFLKAVVDYFETDAPQKILVNGVPKYEIEIRKIESTGSTGETR